MDEVVARRDSLTGAVHPANGGDVRGVVVSASAHALSTAAVPNVMQGSGIAEPPSTDTTMGAVTFVDFGADSCGDGKRLAFSAHA